MFDFADGRSAETPLVIRGESGSKRLTPGSVPPSFLSGEILIDTVSMTFPVSEVEKRAGGSVSIWTETADVVVARLQAFCDWLFGARLFELGDLSGGRNNFDQSIKFDNKAGFIAWGGNNAKRVGGEVVGYAEERLQLYVSGDGCSRVPDFSGVGRRAMSLCGSRISRIDIACDLHRGELTVDDCRRWWEEGLFTTTGRPPKGKLIDDMGSGAGCTFYVGNRDNGKMLRCYEKGKQLGDPGSPWVRFEIEYGSKDREIPFDVFSDPAAYLAGSYPAMSWVSKVKQVIRTCREKLDIQFDKLVDIARTQYGKLLHFANRFVGWDPEKVFREIVNVDDYPERLKWCVKSSALGQSIIYRGTEYGYVC